MHDEDGKRPIRSLAVIANQAFSIVNFRGPMIEAIVAAGVRVHALAPDYDEATRAAVRALGAEPVDISLDRAGMRPLRDLRDALRLRRQLVRLKPDATFAYFIKPVIYGSLAARAAGIPRRYALVAGLGYVFTPDGSPDRAKRRLLRRAVSALYRRAFGACECVFFQNDDDIAHFVDAGLIDPSKIRKLPGTGVDLAHFPPVPLVEAPLTFLLVARLLKEKGIREFVEAARIVRAAHPAARFVLVGGLDPNPGGFTQRDVDAWIEEGVVELPGHVADVRPWIARSGVFVLPSYREGSPRSTQEAMAMGRPVITTDAPGCRNTVIAGVNGFLVPVRDSVALAAAMQKFIDDRSLIAPMGRESRRIAEERFDVHRVNRTILAVMGLPRR